MIEDMLSLHVFERADDLSGDITSAAEVRSTACGNKKGTNLSFKS
jgi:hypothetical protein